MNKSFWPHMSVLLFLWVAIGLHSSPEFTAQDLYPKMEVASNPGFSPLAESPVSMVTTAFPTATQAGLEMLRRGGNAMDATIAATLVTAVVDTGLTTLAGGGQITYYDAETRTTTTINCEPHAFREDVMPYNRERDDLTGRSIRVPGTLGGFFYAILKYGALGWEEVLEPAIHYADQGFVIHGYAYHKMWTLYDKLTIRPSSLKMFAPGGFLPPPGAVFKQPEMAETLKKVAQEGPDYFYRGPFAEKMVEAIREIGGKATLEDFASYKAMELEPIRGVYKDYRILGPPPPAYGAACIIEGMNILELADLQEMGHYTQSSDALQWVIETLRVIYGDNSKYCGIPEFDQALAKILTSKDYARRRYQFIRHKIEQMKKRGKASSYPATTTSFRAEDVEEPGLGTHQVSAVDRDGNICSLTHTVYGGNYGTAGLFVGGISLNGAGMFRAQPGERIVSPVCPLIVFKGEKPYFATGSSGSILNTFFTTLNVIVWEMDLKEAQEAPRFRPPDGHSVKIENRIEDHVARELKRRGYRFEWAGPYSYPFGGAQMAGIDPETGVRYGATDPRFLGLASGEEK